VLILTQRAGHARALDAAGRGDFEAAYENAATVAPGQIGVGSPGQAQRVQQVAAADRSRC
jgi:hypothetical protein